MVWLWSLAALLLGVVIGWVLRRRMREEALRAEYEARLQHEVRRVRHLETQLAERGVELEASRAGAAKAQSDLLTMRERIEHSEADLAAAKSAAVEATARITQLESRVSKAHADRQDVQEKAEGLHRDLVGRETRIAELEAELDALRHADEVEMTVDVRQPPTEKVRVASGAPSKEDAVARVQEIARRTAGSEPAPHDDLTRISGIGPKIDQLLKGMGITSFRQIARFDADDIAHVSAALDAFPGRIERDDWMSKAAALHRDAYGDDG